MFLILTNQSSLIKTILLVAVLFVLFSTPVLAQIGEGVLPPVDTATTPAEGIGAVGVLPPAQNTTPSATTGGSPSSITDWKIETGIPIAGLEKGTAVKDPGVYFNKIYTFAVSASMVVAIIMIVYAGLMWMTSPYLVQKKEAIDRMTGVALGVLLLLASNLILKTINPNLVNWDLSGLTSIEGLSDSIFGIGTEGIAGGGGGGGETTGGGSGGDYVAPGSGWCSKESLEKYAPEWTKDEKTLKLAMCVCEAESAGSPSISNTTNANAICNNKGNPKSVVWGLWQIDLPSKILTDSNGNKVDCRNIIDRPITYYDDHPGEWKDCYIKDEALYNKCVNIAKDPALNFENAVAIQKSQGWGAWSSALPSMSEYGGAVGSCYKFR